MKVKVMEVWTTISIALYRQTQWQLQRSTEKRILTSGVVLIHVTLAETALVFKNVQKYINLNELILLIEIIYFTKYLKSRTFIFFNNSKAFITTFISPIIIILLLLLFLQVYVCFSTAALHRIQHICIKFSKIKILLKHLNNSISIHIVIYKMENLYINGYWNLI